MNARISMLVSVAAVASPSIALAQSFGGTQRIANLSSCVAIAQAPGDHDRLFVLTLSGQVRIVRAGVTLPGPFLSVSPCCGNGATGLVFDPDFGGNGYFYIAYTATGGHRLERYRVSDNNPNLADPASGTRIITTPLGGQHTGGWIGFGRDGYLYFSGGDTVNHTLVQVADNLVGKMLRLDVRTDAFPEDPDRFYTIPPTNPWVGQSQARGEVWATGLRNAFRCSFDRETGDLWIADVGQSAREEINRQPADSAGGENYGWPCREGTVNGPGGTGCTPLPALTPPLFELTRNQSICIVGGYVYRGCSNPKMRGRYVFGNCGTGTVWSIDAAQPAGSLMNHTSQLGISGLYGFGEDLDGELYACTSNGVYKLLPPAGAWFSDCNSNGRADECEIANGSETDVNGDGLPDSCTRLCPADFDASGALGPGDIFWFVGRWYESRPDADFNLDTAVTLQDLLDFLAAYNTGC